MNTCSTLTLVAVVLIVGVISGCGTIPPKRAAFPDAATLPAQTALPDPLVMLDGRRVTSRAQWENERRPELKELFQHYMYGAIPPKPANTKFKVVAEHRDFLGGKATLKLVTIDTGGPGSPQIDLMLVLPNERRGPVPDFLAVNFCGNHTLTDDPRVPPRDVKPKRHTLERGAVHVVRHAIEVGVAAEHDQVLDAIVIADRTCLPPHFAIR